MKPMGPLPPEFATQHGALMIGGRSAEDWMQGRDGPLFVYDPAIVAARVARFRAAFPTIDLHYAIKANPFPPLLAAMAGLVDGFDVASSGELAKVVELGKPVSFASPHEARDQGIEVACQRVALDRVARAAEGHDAIAPPRLDAKARRFTDSVDIGARYIERLQTARQGFA